MITLLVSSKTMLKKGTKLKLDTSLPGFEKEAELLNSELSKQSVAELQKLMHISENLAKVTKLKIEKWVQEEPWPAWLYFSGDVYKGLVAETLSKEDLEWAQNKVWTLSGLYGIARPLDLVKPYRLEANFRLKVGGKKNLYDFWGKKISDKIAEQIKDKVAINLSSEEYIKLIRGHFKGKITTPLFLQDRISGNKTGVKFEAVHAKVARGMMARWIIENRIDDPARLKEFAKDGYAFDEEKSSELEPVFVRKAEGVMSIKKT